MKAASPLVSILMSSYNHGEFVEQTINSVIAQTYPNWEFIIVDDGSRDDTPAKIERAARNNKKIRFQFLPNNIGACGALEKCYRSAKGKYIAIINSDDTWQPEKLQRQVEYLENNPQTGAVFTRVNIIGEEGQPLEHPFAQVFNSPPNRTRHEWLNHFFFKGNCLCHPSLLIRKDCYEQCGGPYKKELAALPDFDMWIRLCMKYEIHILDERLTNFRVLGGKRNESATNTPNLIRDAFEKSRVLENYLEITSCDEFNRIFSEGTALKNAYLIPLYIARYALQTGTEPHKLLALQTLYNVMADEKYANKMAAHHFNYTDLHNLAKKVDVFAIGKNRAR